MRALQKPKAAKKIQMFNQGGEIALFSKLKFNAVFYGEVLAGIEKPNLMYMTTFQDLKTHDELWKVIRRFTGMEADLRSGRV